MIDSSEAPSAADPLADILPLTILAIDHGEKRIGLAIKPSGHNLALPFGVIHVDRANEFIETLRRTIAERKVNIVVVGLPIHPNSSRAQAVKKFTRHLRETVRGVRWRFVNEMLTSHGAVERLRDSGLGGTTRKPIDDQAALLILESYLAEMQGAIPFPLPSARQDNPDEAAAHE